LARDRFVPRQFANQGDRLVFSSGILILSGFAILLIVVFAGDTHALLPLYAIGVFISFTFSQSGMVRRWLSLREKGWRWRVWVNGVGAVVTFLVLLTLAFTKFVEGAWIVVVVIPLLVGAFVVMLVVLTSPYRSLLRPFLDYLNQIQGRGDDQMVTIVLPEFLPRKWWQHFLHNQTALLIKGALLFRRNTVVADVPYLLKH